MQLSVKSLFFVAGTKKIELEDVTKAFENLSVDTNKIKGTICDILYVMHYDILLETVVKSIRLSCQISTLIGCCSYRTCG